MEDDDGHKNRAKPGHLAITTNAQFIQIIVIIICHHLRIPKL